MEAHGYCRVTALLRSAGWVVNAKRVERIWRREGLKVPAKQSDRGRLWLNDGSCVRLRPERPSHVWFYDFVEDRTHDKRKFRMLNVIDEFTRECLTIRVACKLKAADVIDVLSELFLPHAACLATSGPATGRSSWPRRCATGSRLSAPSAPSSNRAALGIEEDQPTVRGLLARRWAIARGSTQSSETNCSTARCSTAWLKPRSSLSAGASTTTTCARTHCLATNRPHRPPSRGRLRYLDRLRQPLQP